MTTPLIIPAILEYTQPNLDTKVFQVSHIPGVERVHVDFSDGIFAHPASLALSQLVRLNPAYTWEAHLMVNRPVNFSDYKQAGFETIIIHYEAFSDDVTRQAALAAINELGLTPGLALSPQTEISVVAHFAQAVSLFTILSVAPGKQGQEFISESLERIALLRKLIPHATIEVDGGIRTTNIREVVSAGADRIVVGSALYETQDTSAHYEKIQNAAHGL